jgi:preprotein translocase subunit YajC
LRPQEDSAVVEAIVSLLPFLLILVFFYFILIRPQKNRARQTIDMQSRLAPGHRVMTTAGLYGTVSSVEDDVVVLETSPGITSRWARQAVARILDEEPVLGAPDDVPPTA